LRSNVAAGARPVVDDDGGAQRRAELLPDQSRQDVGGAAGREWNDVRDGSVRPFILRSRRQREGAKCERGQRRGNNGTAYKLHVSLLQKVNIKHSPWLGVANWVFSECLQHRPAVWSAIQIIRSPAQG